MTYTWFSREQTARLSSQSGVVHLYHHERKTRDASDKLEAENYTNGVGFGRETGGGETYLAGMFGPNNPYAMYNYIDFGAKALRNSMSTHQRHGWRDGRGQTG